MTNNQTSFKPREGHPNWKGGIWLNKVLYGTIIKRNCLLCSNQFEYNTKKSRSNKKLCSIECKKEYNKKYKREWYNKPENRGKILEKLREYRENNKEILNEKKRKRSREERRVMRLAALEYYSKGSMDCECCHENNIEFLTLDHIDGGGGKHRKELKKKGIGSNFFIWLRKQGYPSGLRVLCMNCNFSLGNRGYCPHKNKQGWERIVL